MLKFRYLNFIILVSFNLYSKDKPTNLVAKYYDTSSYSEKEILDKFNTLRVTKGKVGKYDVKLAKRFVNAYVKKINEIII